MQGHGDFKAMWSVIMQCVEISSSLAMALHKLLQNTTYNYIADEFFIRAKCKLARKTYNKIVIHGILMGLISTLKQWNNLIYSLASALNVASIIK